MLQIFFCPFAPKSIVYRQNTKISVRHSIYHYFLLFQILVILTKLIYFKSIGVLEKQEIIYVTFFEYILIIPIKTNKLELLYISFLRSVRKIWKGKKVKFDHKYNNHQTSTKSTTSAGNTLATLIKPEFITMDMTRLQFQIIFMCFTRINMNWN